MWAYWLGAGLLAAAVVGIAISRHRTVRDADRACDS